MRPSFATGAVPSGPFGGGNHAVANAKLNVDVLFAWEINAAPLGIGFRSTTLTVKSPWCGGCTVHLGYGGP